MALMARQAGEGGRTARRPTASPTSFRPSTQQRNFLTGLQVTEQHILLEARAGSGKSTTCREGAKLLPRNARAVYCCFNKTIADEFRPGLPRNCQAATMHSLGLRILREAFGQVEIEEHKVDRLAEKYFPGWERRGARIAVGRLVSLCKNLLADSSDREFLRELAAVYGIDLPRDQTAEVLGVVNEVITECGQATATIDFDDMIWLPVVRAIALPSQPDVVFVDEAQDLNACQHAMLDLICLTGRQIIVGDRYQSIYAFRGANAESIPMLDASLSATDRGLARFPLTVTRRCPRSVVELARQLVPDLDHLPDAPEGTIEQVKPEQWSADVAEGDMVLCRTNAPLVSAAYRLIRSGVRASVRGRDIGKGILALVARLRVRDVPSLARALEDYRSAELSRLSDLRNASAGVQALNDRCDCLAAIAEGATSIEEVKARAESMFTDLAEHNCVSLSSIHRAKGLERDRVVILRPELIPGPWAATKEDLQQERNLGYVAVTRAKQRLTFAGDVPSLFQIHESADSKESIDGSDCQAVGRNA